MSRSLSDLTPFFRAQVVEFLARLVEAQIPVMVVDTLRTPEEQKENLLKGVSWTSKSKHLPNSVDGKAQAVDICPYDEFRIRGMDKLYWQTHDSDGNLLPVWKQIGEIGESCGLEWGGRWPNNPPKSRPDYGHFQLNES